MGAETDAALLEYSGQILNSSINYAAQADINKRTQKYNREMYERQRADSLADWTRQNEYNSPTSQMARLREAGLNPNLVYGKGADNTAQAIRSSTPGSWNPKAAPMNFGYSNALATYYDVQMKQAQIDNLKVQNTVATQEALLKAATTANTVQSTAKSAFDLGLASELKTYTLEGAKENLRKLRTGIDIDLQENERKQAMNSSNLAEATERILNLRASRANTEAERKRIETDIERMKGDSQLKQLDIDLKKNGIQPTDNIFLRLLGRILAQYGIGVQDLPPSSFNPGNSK